MISARSRSSCSTEMPKRSRDLDLARRRGAWRATGPSRAPARARPARRVRLTPLASRRDDVEPGDDRGAGLGRLERSATWSRKPSTKLHEAAELDGRGSTTDAAVGVALDRACPGPTAWQNADLVARRRSAPARRWPRPSPYSHGWSARYASARKSVGTVNAPGVAGLDVALDAVGPEHAHLVGAEVEADHVPVTELRREPPRLELAGPAPVARSRTTARRRDASNSGASTSTNGSSAIGARARALEPAELHQRAPRRRRAAEPDRGDRDVQRRELVVGEVEIGEVVLLRVDPVAGTRCRRRCLADRHAHRPQRSPCRARTPCGPTPGSAGSRAWGW